MRRHLLAALYLAFPATLAAQADSVTTLRGAVRDSAGRPVSDVDVFILTTLEGATTDTAGRFLFQSRAQGAVTLVFRKIGYPPIRRDAVLPLAGPIEIVLGVAAVALEEISVSAGTYIAGEERGAQLTPLEVATTPGTTADIGRAIQTLPGVQSVDEGTALFVRGGDYLETKVFVNDALLLTGFRYDSPTGTFANTPNAFLMDGIFFSSGGFGARFGNALSGVVSLRTLGRPAKTLGSLNVGLGALSAGGGWAPSARFGARATVTRFSTSPIFWLNGTPREYDPAPNGSDASISATWSYRESGEIKVFAIDQLSRMGIVQELPGATGTYRNRSRNSVAILSWRDSFGRFSQTASLAIGRRAQREAFGPFFDLEQRATLVNFFTYAGYDASDRLTLRAGGEWERLAASFAGTKGVSLDSRTEGDRLAAFIESDWRVGGRLKVTPGLRTDRSTLSGTRTLDPRIAAAFLLGHEATLTLAGGVYHQVAEPLFYDPELGHPGLEPMRADQVVGGFQLGEGDRIVRIEVYAKRYRDLAQMNRDDVVVGGGTGSSRGIDLFLKGNAAWRISARVAYSYIHARRTDPNTGLMAPAPADITHALTLVLERPIGGSVSSGIAVHYATGRPYTSVVAATPDGGSGFTPVFGPPMGSRVPPLVRLDANLNKIVSLGPGAFMVLYASVNNLLGRENIYQYTWTRDYARRIAVPSLFNRSFYFGVTLNTR